MTLWGTQNDIIETLFWLEESATSLPARGKGTRFPEYTAPGNLIHLTAMTPAKPSETARPTYNEDDYESAGSPVALTFEYGLVNDFLSEWCEMKTKLNNGEISPNEYFEWKITWPHAWNIMSSAVHHLDSASLHLDGGRSPYMNRNLLSMECKHSKPSIFYSRTTHFSTKIVPQGKKQARKCPFY